MTDPSTTCKIIQAVAVTDQLFEACQRLVPQMTSNNPPPTRAQLELLLSGGPSCLFLALESQGGSDDIVGLATLIIYRVPTGLRGYIEDVVVQKTHRGRGIGEALVQACLEKARQDGCPQVMLTCNPGRDAANRLYQRMGFELRKTNVYRYSLNKDN
jgi:ribosomal protein S18 acetylase RimI-like enzyme